jgi:hypothetical protein
LQLQTKILTSTLSSLKVICFCSIRNCHMFVIYNANAKHWWRKLHDVISHLNCDNLVQWIH